MKRYDKMPTSSFTKNIIFETKEEVQSFIEALKKAEEWARNNKKDFKIPITEDEKKLIELLKVNE